MLMFCAGRSGTNGIDTTTICKWAHEDDEIFHSIVERRNINRYQHGFQMSPDASNMPGTKEGYKAFGRQRDEGEAFNILLMENEDSE